MNKGSVKTWGKTKGYDYFNTTSMALICGTTMFCLIRVNKGLLEVPQLCWGLSYCKNRRDE